MRLWTTQRATARTPRPPLSTLRVGVVGQTMATKLDECGSGPGGAPPSTVRGVAPAPGIGRGSQRRRRRGVRAVERTAVLLLVVIAATSMAPGLVAQGPPARFFGTVSVDGATPPQGTVVQAYIGDRLCGEGTVRQLGAEIPVGYVVDVKSSAQQEGCGEDGNTVKLKVGGRDAPQSDTYVTGGFIRVDLSLSGAVQTPPPGPTPPPFVQATPVPAASATPAPSSPPASAPPASSQPSPAASGSPAPSGTPGPSGSPGASPAAGASGSPSARPESSGSPSPSPSASASSSPGASPSGSDAPTPGAGTTIIPSPAPSGGGGNGTAVALAAVVALIALAALGGLFYRSRRRRGDDGGDGGDAV